ncbi:MAG: AMP-binding protein, partial [Bacteroidales bacterium]
MTSYDWSRRYDAGVPRSLEPYPSRTLLAYFADALDQRPDATFLIFKGRRLSYAEVDGASSAFAAALVARGVRKGDRVAIVLPNCPQAIIAQLGTWKAGAIAAPMNPLYTERELEY